MVKLNYSFTTAGGAPSAGAGTADIITSRSIGSQVSDALIV